MAEFNFFNRGEPMKTIGIQAAYKEKMEEICAAEDVSYSVEKRGDVYVFTVPAAQYPRIEKYFRKPESEEKKTSLGDQLGSAEERQASQVRRGLQRGPRRPVVDPQAGARSNSIHTERASEVAEPDFGVLTLEEQRRLDELQARTEAEKKPKKKRAKTGRDNQVKTRLTDTEMQLFSERVKASGLKQGDFMRECLLHEEVHVRSLTDIDAQAFGKLMEMSSDLGRIGGLIKGTVMANKDEFSVLTAGEKTQLEVLIRELQTVKDDLLKVVQNLYGNS